MRAIPLGSGALDTVKKLENAASPAAPLVCVGPVSLDRYVNALFGMLICNRSMMLVRL